MGEVKAGETIGGKYRLVERLGAGGMGEVWLAVQEGAVGFRRTVVCKFVPHEQRDNDRLALMLADEARILGLLHHPNIVAPVDFIDGEDGPLLVLEYVEGCSLRTALRLARRNREAMPEGLASFIGQEIARALEAAHTAVDEHGQPLNLVHRDVSPDNVLLTWRGRVRLADFGVAFALGNLDITVPGAPPKGKRGYMAPEQAAGKLVGPRADIFALGRVVAETADVSCGPALRAVLDKAVAEDPADRFESAEAFAQALFKTCPPPSDPTGALALWLARAAPEAIQPTQTSPGGEPSQSAPPAPRKPFLLDLSDSSSSKDGSPPPGQRPRAEFILTRHRRHHWAARLAAAVGAVIALSLPVAWLIAEAEGVSSIGAIHFHRMEVAPDAELRVRSAPSGAEVYVDGVLRGDAPLTLHLAEGKHSVRVGNPHLEHWRATDIVLHADVIKVLEVDLTE